MIGPVNRASERIAVAVIRAWVESDGTTLKVRVMTSGEDSREPRTIGVTADIDHACAIVRTWLVAFAVGDTPTLGSSGESVQGVRDG
jgi:hypothetical protein